MLNISHVYLICLVGDGPRPDSLHCSHFLRRSLPRSTVIPGQTGRRGVRGDLRNPTFHCFPNVTVSKLRLFIDVVCVSTLVKSTLTLPGSFDLWQSVQLETAAKKPQCWCILGWSLCLEIFNVVLSFFLDCVCKHFYLYFSTIDILCSC